MSLRNSLRSATELRVARVNQRNSQLPAGFSATDPATTAQRPAGSPRQHSVSGATATATTAQHPDQMDRNSGADDEKLRVAFAKTRNSQLGGLTAHRLLPDLIAAIGRCCDVRGDDERNRAALVAEAADFAPEQQRDLTQHFDQEAAIWAAATGRGAV